MTETITGIFQTDTEIVTEPLATIGCVASIDWGSVNVKVNINGKEDWLSYSPEIITTAGIGVVKVLRGENLARFKESLHRIWNNADGEETISVLGITGAVQPCWIRHRDQNGEEREFLFFDDPTPPADFSTTELQDISQILGMPVTKINAATGLNKAKLIRDDPHLLQIILNNPEASFENTIWGSLSGFLAKELTGNNSYSFPYDDRTSMGLNGATAEQVMKLMTYLGFKPDQFNIHENSLLTDKNKSGKELRILFAGDLSAELQILNLMKEAGIISANMWIYAWDSVVKKLSFVHEGPKQREGIYYWTQRMGANVNRLAAKILGCSMDQAYVVSDDLLRHSSPSRLFIFDPFANENCGQFYWKSGKKWLPISEKQIRRLSWQFKLEAIRAANDGVVCSALLLSGVLGESNGHYGGFVSAKNRKGFQLGRRHHIVEMTPQNIEVIRILLPSAATAVKFLAARAAGIYVDINDLGEPKPMSGGKGKGNPYFKLWQREITQIRESYNP